LLKLFKIKLATFFLRPAVDDEDRPGFT